jgi:hypothetical protein
MAKIKGRIIDRNRWVKKYPYVRIPKRPTYMGDKDLEMEVLTVTFTNETERTVHFERPFPNSDYSVALSARHTTDSDSAQVNLYIDNRQSTASVVVIKASAPFTGAVDIIVVKIS